MSPPIEEWANAFVWTCAIELPVYVLFLRQHFTAPHRAILVALLLQACTHPVLWYVVPYSPPYWRWVILAELGVTTTEALIAAGFISRHAGWPRALGVGALASITANVTSTLVGLGMNRLLYG